jgi:hypothetical protein
MSQLLNFFTRYRLIIVLVLVILIELATIFYFIYFNSQTPVSYKNAFLPGFELKYDRGWKVEKTTKPSQYSGLEETKILFTKDQISFSIDLFPLPLRGCGGDLRPSPSNIKDFGNKVFRVSWGNGKNSKVFYSKYTILPDCDLFNVLNSNIKAADVPEYKKDFANASNVTFIFAVNLINPSATAPESDFAEIDKVISQSKFE